MKEAVWKNCEAFILRITIDALSNTFIAVLSFQVSSYAMKDGHGSGQNKGSEMRSGNLERRGITCLNFSTIELIQNEIPSLS